METIFCSVARRDYNILSTIHFSKWKAGRKKGEEVAQGKGGKQTYICFYILQC